MGVDSPRNQEPQSPDGGGSPWDCTAVDHERDNMVLPAPVPDEAVSEAVQPVQTEAAPDEGRAIPIGIEGNRDLKAEAVSL